MTKHLASLLQIAGATSVTVAAFLVAAFVGFAVLGAFLMTGGYLLAKPVEVAD